MYTWKNQSANHIHTSLHNESLKIQPLFGMQLLTRGGSQSCTKQRGDLERYPGCRWASELPQSQGCLSSKSQTAPGFVLCWLNQNHPFVSTEIPWPTKEPHSTVIPCTACSRLHISSPLPTCVMHRSQGREMDKRVLWILSWVQVGTALSSCNSSWRSDP